MAMSAFALDAVSGAPSYTGKMLRTALASLLGPPPTGRPLGATTGVRPGTPTSTVSVAGSTVTIAPHAGVLDVQADATTGPYLYAVTAAETVTLNAAHATYTRWDRISVQLSDPAAGDGTSVPGVAIVYTPGTPAASPALPAAPARSLTLARIVVPQSGGGSASVVWLAPETGTGDVRWYATESDRGVALPSPAPDMVAVIGSGASMAVTVWDGTAWRTVWSRSDGWGAWSNLTPATGTGTARYRTHRQGGVIDLAQVEVLLSGATIPTSVSGSTTEIVAVGGLPSGARAAEYTLVPANATGTTNILAALHANGSIRAHNTTGGTLGVFRFSTTYAPAS